MSRQISGWPGQAHDAEFASLFEGHAMSEMTVAMTHVVDAATRKSNTKPLTSHDWIARGPRCVVTLNPAAHPWRVNEGQPSRP
jgi:hypothetical protein